MEPLGSNQSIVKLEDAPYIPPCRLCKNNNKSKIYKSIFKVDLPDRMMECLDLGRYGNLFCENCHEIVNSLITEYEE